MASCCIGRRPHTFLLGIALAIGPGCGEGGGSSEVTAAGVKVKVLHPPWGGALSKEKSGDGRYEVAFRVGDPKRKTLTVVIDRQRLKIEGRAYGEVKAGDEVVIDARRDDLRVTVGGVERKPAE